ncbi:MAG: YfhO family protein [Thermoanaerobaculia bacterium]
MRQDGGPLSGWRGHALGALFLAATAAAALFPLLSGARSFLHWDLFYEHVPIWSAVQRALLSGESPFWLDGAYAGNPLLYTQEAPLLYPLTAPLLLSGLAAHRAADLFTLLHFLLAGVFAYALVWDVTRGRVAALVAGTAWMLSARTVQSAIWPNAVAVAALLPLLVLGLLRIGRGRRRSGIILAALGGGLMLLAARPHSVIGAAPLLLAVSAFAVASAPRRAVALRDTALAALLAAGLGAPSVLPTAILHSEMDRSSGLSAEERNVDALRAGGDLDLVFLPRDGRDRFPEAACYPGLAAGLLFAAGLLLAARGPSPDRPLLLALATGGAVGLAFAFGDAGPYRLLSWMPVLRDLHVPARYLVSWAFAVSIGAGLAASALAARGRLGAASALAALVVLAPDLVLHTLRAVPAADSAHYRAVPPLATRLRSEPPDGTGFPRRFWTTRVGLPDRLDPKVTPGWAASVEPLSGALGQTWGLEGLEGRGPSLLRIRRLLDAFSSSAPGVAAVSRIVSEVPALPFEAEGVPGPISWSVPNPRDRAWLVPAALVVPEGRALPVALAPGFDAGSAVVLERAEPRPGADWKGARGTVRLAVREGAFLSLELSAPGPGWLVLADAFEEGWSATLDGLDAAVYPANGAFRAVAVPEGSHRLDFRYEPRGLREGLLLAAASLLGLFLGYRRLPAD